MLPLKRRHRPAILLALGLLCLLMIGVAVPIRRKAQQQQLNRALIVAVKRKDTPAAVALLRQGADPNFHDDMHDRDSLWQMIRDVAQGKRRKRQPTWTALLLALKPKADFDDLMDAPDLPQNAPDNVALITALLNHGADVNAKDPTGYTALLYSIRWEKRAIARLLLQHGANVNQADGNNVTPLMYAVYMADTAAIRQLLDYGARTEAQDSISGGTALMLAVTLNRPSCVAALLVRHPNIQQRDHNGKTALDYARINRNRNVIIPLLERATVRQ